MIWCCPKCRGSLLEIKSGARCSQCNADYESIGGILDLRVPHAMWIDAEDDKNAARQLLAETEGFSVEQLVRHVYSSRPEWTQALIEKRTRQVMAAPNRLRADINGWLRPHLEGDELFLDLGCGPGMLLAAAAGEGKQGIGVDVSLVWLVVAQRLIAAWGGRPVLAAALGEALPLADGAVKSVISLDVIEHVDDPAFYLREINRVTKPGGYIALTTPNRYSLTAEPHVYVWGVGWLPRAWQKHYVKWRSGKSYDFVRLLSSREAIRLLRRQTQFRPTILIPPISDEEITHFAPLRARVATLYNRLSTLPSTRRLFLKIGPFFQIVGQKKKKH